VDKHNEQFAMVSEQEIAVLVLIQRSMLLLSIKTLRNIVLQSTISRLLNSEGQTVLDAVLNLCNLEQKSKVPKTKN